jgi:hypothetical protein
MDFIRVCLLMGSWIFIFGSPATPRPDCKIICVSRQPNGRPVLSSSLAQAEGQVKADGIDILGPLQDQITAPNNGPEVVLNNLGKHVMWRSQGTNPNRSGMLFSLRDNMKEFSEIIQIWRQDYLIIWTGKNLEYWHPDELTDDLRINSDNMSVHRRLKNYSMIISLNNLEICIE